MDKEIKLTQLFEESEYKEVERLLNKGDWKELRKYLNSKKDKLEKKGVLADYLYYYLQYSFNA